ncbi:hypothetical protein C5167_001212 [Papaver somniferum]|uniref:Uncharacterized protein n=1 Tax=Papaver somniferum TaxID=3469 RepID=A0A4Y7KW89_PAPSO|nr:hypothetical protein C5167_001212 [Papaver somniferum]
MEIDREKRVLLSCSKMGLILSALLMITRVFAELNLKTTVRIDLLLNRDCSKVEKEINAGFLLLSKSGFVDEIAAID